MTSTTTPTAAPTNPEIGRSVQTGQLRTNYHDSGPPSGGEGGTDPLSRRRPYRDNSSGFQKPGNAVALPSP